MVFKNSPNTNHSTKGAKNIGKRFSRQFVHIVMDQKNWKKDNAITFLQVDTSDNVHAARNSVRGQRNSKQPFDVELLCKKA